MANQNWQNEGSGRKRYLLGWNKGEEFDLSGIGILLVL